MLLTVSCVTKIIVMQSLRAPMIFPSAMDLARAGEFTPATGMAIPLCHGLSGIYCKRSYSDMGANPDDIGEWVKILS
jgi:hypothetical protein